MGGTALLGWDFYQEAQVQGEAFALVSMRKGSEVLSCTRLWASPCTWDVTHSTHPSTSSAHPWEMGELRVFFVYTTP